MFVDPLTVISSLVTLLAGAWIGHKLTERRERQKSEREDDRKRAEGEETAGRADRQLRFAIATAVNSVRSQLWLLYHSVSPEKPATSEQIERIEAAGTAFRSFVERIDDLRDEGLRREVLAWHLNLARAPDDLEMLSHPPDDFARIEHEHLRATKRAGESTRRQAARRRLQFILDDGTKLELIGSVWPGMTAQRQHRVNRIYVLESLPEGDLRTGRDLYDSVLAPRTSDNRAFSAARYEVSQPLPVGTRSGYRCRFLRGGLSATMPKRRRFSAGFSLARDARLSVTLTCCEGG